MRQSNETVTLLFTSQNIGYNDLDNA